MKLRLITMTAMAALAVGLVQAQAPAVGGNTTRQQLRAQRALALRGRVTAKGLTLSDAQKQQVKTIRQQAQQTAEPVREQLQQNRAALTAAVKAGNAAQIQALSQTQGELAGKALAIRSQAQAQIYAGLTNEQRQKLDAAQARMQQRIAKRQANLGLAN
jgi:Spy/CpxP family protein refolding chaperone